MDAYQAMFGELEKWVKSENRLEKRAAAVSLILTARMGRFLENIFKIGNMLLSDQNDMVQPGHGWLLKEVSRVHHLEVHNYGLKNR